MNRCGSGSVASEATAGVGRRPAACVVGGASTGRYNALRDEVGHVMPTVSAIFAGPSYEGGDAAV